MLSSVNISYYMLFVYNNLGELHVGDRQKKKKNLDVLGGWQNHGSGKREKKTKKCVGVGILG